MTPKTKQEILELVESMSGSRVSSIIPEAWAHLSNLIDRIEQDTERRVRDEIELVIENAENCAILAQEADARNIRHNIIQPLKAILLAPTKETKN